jgi:hypothetical protein
MRVLIACEFSGIVRDAFIAQGHDAISCDLLPSEKSGPHIQGDALEAARSQSWDLMIAHPPCTYLCGMGVWWNHKRPERWPLTIAAQDFVIALWDCGIQRTCIENPIGYLGTHWRKSNQIINPWQFGQEANKPTCLWLRGLPLLQPTKIVGKGKFYVKKNGARMSAWSHITSGTKKEERARIASRTFTGIADAMANQWGKL